MIREAIDKILAIQENKIHVIDGRSYSEKSLHEVVAPEYAPRSLEVGSLDALVELLRVEMGKVIRPIFIEIESPRKVSVYTTYDDKFKRQTLYEAVSDVPTFNFSWKDYESAMIAFRSQFEQNANIEYVLGLLSKIVDDNSVATSDNGLSQTVEVKKGVTLKAVENIKPIVKLRPYRTFLEVEQPESEFLLRLAEGGAVGLFEADGGMWKLTAKKNIRDYFVREFAGIDDIIVMM